MADEIDVFSVSEKMRGRFGMCEACKRQMLGN